MEKVIVYTLDDLIELAEKDMEIKGYKIVEGTKIWTNYEIYGMGEEQFESIEFTDFEKEV